MNSQPAPTLTMSGPPVALQLKFWGVRGSIPTPGPSTVEYGGNTSCLELRAGGQIIILDAGTGLRVLGRELQAEYGEQPMDLTLLLTHTHWDHIQGLPFFMPVYKSQNHLRILGYEGARNGLSSVLTSQMESPFFPINLHEVPANVRIEELKEKSFSLGPVQVQAFAAYHPGTCVGYRLSYHGRSIAFFPDNELRYRSGNNSASGNSSSDSVRESYRQLSDFLRGTDVLVMDTQYDCQEYADHVGWGHGCVDQVVMLALGANVRHLYLFHHDPDHDDAKVSEMVADARRLVGTQKGSLAVDAAREGLTVELKADVEALKGQKV